MAPGSSCIVPTFRISTVSNRQILVLCRLKESILTGPLCWLGLWTIYMSRFLNPSLTGKIEHVESEWISGT